MESTLDDRTNSQEKWWHRESFAVAAAVALLYFIALVNLFGIYAGFRSAGLEMVTGMFGPGPNGDLATPLYPHLEFVLVTALSLGTYTLIRNRSWPWHLGAAATAPLLGAILAMSLYSILGVAVDPMTIGISVLLVLIPITFKRLTTRLLWARKLRQILGTSVTSQTISGLSNNTNLIALDGASTKVSVLYCELRGLQELIDTLRDEPEGIVTIIRMVVEPMMEEVLKSNGSVERLTNTKIQGVWNAPRPEEHHEQVACDCAMDMVRRLDTINNQLDDLANQVDRPIPQLSISIGINTGYATVGNFGTEERPYYSVVGESALLAEGLQKASEAYGPAIIVGEHTKNAVQNNFAMIEVDRIGINPQNPPIRAYALAGNPVTKASPAFQAMQDGHIRLFKAYRAQNWQQSREELAKFADHPGIHPKLYELYAQRVDYFEKNPPGPNWDGAFRPQVL